jgi:hypothetical protein
MTIVTKGMGAIIKKFGKKTAKHMADTKTRHKSWKKMGLKGPTYKIGKKVKGSHHLDEVWTFDKNYPKGKAEGGRIGFKQGGAYGPLRGTTAGGVAKAFRGKAGFKESQALQKKLKKKSEYKLKNQLKEIQKMPDKKFKYNNPETTKARTRHGFVYDKPKSAPVKGSIGKKKYKQDWIKGHRAHQRMGLIKD